MIRVLSLSALSLIVAGCLSQSRDLDGQLRIKSDLASLDRTETIRGIDRNKNGIRDDIETIIHDSYSEPITQQLVVELAKKLQQNISIDHSDKSQVAKAHIETVKTLDCLTEHLSNRNMPVGDIINDLNLLTNNTGYRFSSALSYEDAVEGLGELKFTSRPSCFMS